MECFFYPTSTPTVEPPIMSLGLSTDNGHDFTIFQRLYQSGFGFRTPNSSTTGLRQSVVNTLPLNTWCHIALTRSTNWAYLYSNGIAVLSTNTVNHTYNENKRLLLYQTPTLDSENGQGNINSARVVVGQALYTGNFTPPTQQLTTSNVGTTGANVATSLTGTVAFLGGTRNSLIDAGPSALPLTISGSPTISINVPSTFTPLIGINCNAPQFALDVNGTANFNGAVTMSNIPANNIMINTANQIILLANGLPTANPYLFAQAASNRIRIGSFQNVWMPFTINEGGGNVGIATTGPGYALDVTGQVRATVGFVSPSDQRAKQNIVSADTSICYSTMQGIDLKYFQWNSTIQSTCKLLENHQLGFIAQEIKQVFPNSITLTSSYGYNDFHSMDTSQLNAMHYGATKKLMDLVEQQGSTLHGMQQELSTLRG